MKLIDLEPRWITPDIFIFRSPSGAGDWLTCKRVPLSGQYRFLAEHCKAETAKGKHIVGMKDDYCWNFEAGASFETLTVTPSIDASASGNWHGFITNGLIVGGI